MNSCFCFNVCSRQAVHGYKQLLGKASSNDAKLSNAESKNSPRLINHIELNENALFKLDWFIISYCLILVDKIFLKNYRQNSNAAIIWGDVTSTKNRVPPSCHLLSPIGGPPLPPPLG